MAIVPTICFTTIAAIVIPILDNDDDKGYTCDRYHKYAITRKMLSHI
jgi:hypothetical protein